MLLGLVSGGNLLFVEFLSLAVWVQGSVVGKNCSVLSGFLRLNSLVFLRRVAQLQFQLAWLSDLQDVHLLVGLEQVSVLWFSVSYCRYLFC